MIFGEKESPAPFREQQSLSNSGSSFMENSSFKESKRRAGTFLEVGSYPRVMVLIKKKERKKSEA